MIELGSYFKRIAYTGSTDAEISTLCAIHEAHVSAIPFENLSVLLNQDVSLADQDLQRKLIGAARGGYCFEQNVLLWRALSQLGFKVTPLTARVIIGLKEGDPPRPKTHALLLITFDGEQWIADAGFGGMGLLQPIPLIAGVNSDAPLVSFRLDKHQDGSWLLLGNQSGQWEGLYSFNLQPAHLVDYEMASHYTSTHPSSPFRHMLYLASVSRQRRSLLQGNQLLIQTPEGRERIAVDSASKLRHVLKEFFAVDFDVSQLPHKLFNSAAN